MSSGESTLAQATLRTSVAPIVVCLLMAWTRALFYVALSALLCGTAQPAVAGRGSKSTAIPLRPTPRTVTAFCSERARLGKFVVLCPTRYPLVRNSQVTVSGSALLGPSFYWASFNDAAGFDDDNGHLILGGQRPPFSLAGSPKATWPRPGQPHPVQQLGLPRLFTTPMQGGGTYVARRPARIHARAMVGGTGALILLAPPYPEGGFMGGHVIVLWNWQRHGYMLSFHFGSSRAEHVYTLAERVAAALAVARGFTPVTR